MSGTSARESYRSGKRTRPSDSQANRVAPPVLFRLPAVALPAPDAQVNASNINSAAMAMPMSSAAAVATSMPSSPNASSVPAHASVAQPASMATAPSPPAQSAAATISAEKASGQRLLNMMIIVLLLAALAVITWISINRSTSTPSMADKEVGNNAALDTLGELKVPDVTTGALADAPKAQPEANDHGLNLDELKPSNPGDLSLIDLPDSHKDAKVDVTEQSDATDSKSLLVGLDTSGIDASQTAPATTQTPTTPTAQIQLRSPVPLGNSGSTSLVDAGRRTEQLGNAVPGSATTPSFDTVSTPSQPVKIFPASTEPAQNSNASPSTSVNKNSQTDGNSGGSPKLWDGAQRIAPEGLQLSSKSTTGNSPTQVTVSQPLTSEFAMPGVKDAGQNVAQNRAEPTATQATGQPAGQALASQTAPGVTVGGGAPEPYSMQPTTGPGSPRTDLHNNRADLDSMMLFRVAASGAAKSAVSGGANVPSPSTAAPINKYATTPNTSAGGANLYQKPNASPSNGQFAGQINSYAQAVPPGVTNNSPGGYVPATTQMPSANTPSANTPGANNPYERQMQMASGPNTIPANTVGYTQPRGPQPNYGQPPMNPPSGYAPTGYQNYPQPGAQPPAYAPPTNAPAYAQPGYGQPGAQSSYGQPSNGYGPASGSGYPNGTYPSPSPATQNNMPGMNMQGMNMQGMNTQGMNVPSGYQGSASYPTKSPLPGGVGQPGLIGGSGHATAPNGDIAPRPVMGQYGVGMSTPYGTP